MKQFPDLRQLADCPVPEGSRVGARSGQTGQVRAAPSLAVQSDKEKERQVLTPHWPCHHPTLPYSHHAAPSPPITPTPTFGRSPEWPKHTLIPKPDPHSVKELKSGKNKKDSQPNYYCTTTTS